MTIGLFILGVLAILVFFGVIGSVLKKLGMPEWAAFLTILALTLGVVIAPIRLGTINLSISGFLIPLVLLGFLAVRLGFGREIFSAVFSTLVVSAIALGFYMWYPEQNATPLLNSVIFGVSMGVAVAIISRTHKSAAFGAIAGILLFELCVGLYERFNGVDTLFLGSMATLDTIIVACVTAVTLLELVGGLQKSTTSQNAMPNGRFAPITESGEDMAIGQPDQAKQGEDEQKQDQQKEYIGFFGDE